MPTGTVTANGLSSTGKPQVTIDGQKYSSGKCQPSAQGLQVGDRIEFDSNSSNFNGRDIWFINSYKLLSGGTKYPPVGQGSGQNASPSPSSAPQKTIRGGDPVQDVERPAISNWVAAAIASGALKEPEGIASWVRYAKQALREDTTFESDIP